MNILELFSGSRSFGNAAEKNGMNVYASDIFPFDKTDYVTDILNFDITKVPFHPDIIWASPPCEKWSYACGVSGGNIYFESIKQKGKVVGIKPRENFNVKAVYKILQSPDLVKQASNLHIAILEKTLQIINQLKPDYYFIENPFGYMRFYLKEKIEYTNITTYCQYGFQYRKLTNIFSNIKLDLKICRPGSSCHQNNFYLRGTKEKIRNKSVVRNYYESSKIPERLCLEILNSCRDRINA